MYIYIHIYIYTHIYPIMFHAYINAQSCTYDLYFICKTKSNKYYISVGI